jgi:hypothetical protein
MTDAVCGRYIMERASRRFSIAILNGGLCRISPDYPDAADAPNRAVPERRDRLRLDDAATTRGECKRYGVGLLLMIGCRRGVSTSGVLHGHQDHI